MKPKAKWLRDSSPGPTYVRRNVDGVTITRATFEPGMWQETWFPAAHEGYASFDSVHVQLGGRMVENGDLMPMREPGWISSACTYPIPAGTHRRVAIDRVELWCCRAILDDGSADHVDAVQLAHGQELDLPAGSRLMLIAGQLEAADTTFVAPHFISLKSSGRLVTALTDSIAFVWKT